MEINELIKNSTNEWMTTHISPTAISDFFPTSIICEIFRSNYDVCSQ